MSAIDLGGWSSTTCARNQPAVRSTVMSAISQTQRGRVAGGFDRAQATGVSRVHSAAVCSSVESDATTFLYCDPAHTVTPAIDCSTTPLSMRRAGQGVTWQTVASA